MPKEPVLGASSQNVHPRWGIENDGWGIVSLVRPSVDYGFWNLEIIVAICYPLLKAGERVIVQESQLFRQLPPHEQPGRLFSHFLLEALGAAHVNIANQVCQASFPKNRIGHA